MKFLLTILSFFILGVNAQTTLSFTENTNDIVRPGAGATLWNNRDAPNGTMHIPVSGSAQTPLDAYYRFTITQLYNGIGTDSAFDDTFLRATLEPYVVAGKGIRIGFMSACNNCDISFNKLVAYGDGTYNAVPYYWHVYMQAESVKDWKCTLGDQEQWIPNWNSAQYIRLTGKAFTYLANYFDTAMSGGKAWRNAITILDLRMYGAYGEQHSAGIVNSNISEYPSGTFPTAASLDSIMSKQLRPFKIFPRIRFVAPFAFLDAMRLPNTYNPVVYARWMLDHEDSIGWINDHLSDDNEYDHAYLEENDRVGPNYIYKILNRWKSTPLGGEPPGYNSSPANYTYLEDQVAFNKISFFGNGNFAGYNNTTTAAANNVRYSSKLSGYRLRPTTGSMTTTLTSNSSFTVSLTWANGGIAPPYESWNAILQLRNSGGTILQEWTSIFVPKLFVSAGLPITDFPVLGNIAAGSTYKLTLKMADPLGYRNNMPLFITNSQESDGAYILRTGISVVAGVGVNTLNGQKISIRAAGRAF